MTDKQIIIDGVNVKDCKRRIGKDNFCRYYKRPCAENNYNCIWKKYLRKEQECEELKKNIIEIQQDLEFATYCESQECGCDDANECLERKKKQILQKISECEVKYEN